MNQHYTQTKDALCNTRNPVNPDSKPSVADKYNFESINVSKLQGSPKEDLFLYEKTPIKKKNSFAFMGVFIGWVEITSLILLKILLKLKFKYPQALSHDI